jgi:acyl-CoA reductase-like NAD-dependent aldehyde dehydrogenase
MVRTLHLRRGRRFHIEDYGGCHASGAPNYDSTYSELGKLLAKGKSLPNPLAGYVFSRNQQAIDRVLQSLSFGGGAVNQTNVFLFVESMPYGGVGTSGIGN